jgi:hypothetical protein
MTLVLNPQTDVRADWRKAFPEPRTLPGKWNLADVLASDRAARAARSNGSPAIRTSNKMNLPTVAFVDRLARRRGPTA